MPPHDLIIEERGLGLRRRLVSWLLATAGWGLWAYLVLPGLWQLVSLAWHPAARSAEAGSLQSLQHYLLVALALGGGLVAWSLINFWRFAGVERRRPIADVPVEKLANDLELPSGVLRHGRDARVMIVHHDRDGAIDRVDVVR